MMHRERKVKLIQYCEKTYEGDNIPVARAFPVVNRREVDPFLLFDHFGPVDFAPGLATGVPSHPHCGFEAITYLLQGEMEHRDSWGGKAAIRTGDIQWMTTGSGLIHSELPTKDFKDKGGYMEGLQIWVNLPKSNKNVKPGYQHIEKINIPEINMNNQLGKIKIIVGSVLNKKSLINTFSPVSIFDIQFNKSGLTKLIIPHEQILMIYIIAGKIQIKENNQIVHEGQMIYYDQSGDELLLNSVSKKGSYLVLAGKPINESIVRYGPFVANTDGELKQLIMNYQSGKMGKL